MKRTLLLMAFVAMWQCAFAYDFSAVAPSGQTLCYNIVNGEAQVTYQYVNYPRYINLVGALTIPSSVTHAGASYTVTSIGSRAFIGCSGLTSVTIPNSVTSIENYAFYDCSGLTSVTIPNSVTSIENYAFIGCSGLTSVTIPNSVTSIGGYAFYGCSGLTSVTIPNSVTSIGGYAFYGCSGLTTIHFDADSCVSAGTIASRRAFIGCNNISTFTFGNNVKIIPPYLCYNMSSLVSVSIPNSVTTIGDSTFLLCSGLTSLSIGNAVTSIGNSAFSDCSGLTSVAIPNSVTFIGNSAFRNCSGLTTVHFNADSCASVGSFYSMRAFIGCNNISTFTFGNNVKNIPYSLCCDMESLTSITIPNSVTRIGSKAFRGCSGLTSVTIGNSVTSIGSSAFENCSGLTSITIPNSVTYIYSSAFNNCSGLTSVTIGNSVTSIESEAFSGCSGLTSVTIPNSVTSIGNDAFRYCSGLTSVTIPNSVTSIGSYAFYRCSGLTSVTIPNSVTSIGNGAFSFCSGLTIVHFNADSCTSAGSSSSERAFYFSNNISTFTFGSNVKIIPSYLCYGMDSLTSVTLLSETPPTLGYNPFHGYGYNHVIYIPCGSWDSYYNHDDWSAYRFRLREPAVEGCSIEVASHNDNFGSAIIITRHNGAQVLCNDSTAVIEAIARHGYHFDHWSNGNTANPDTLHLLGDSLVTAFFAPNQHTITVISADESLGTASGGGTYHYGDTILLMATATAEHYHFSHWSGPSDIWLSNYSNPWRYTVGDYDATWIANFAIDTHTVSVASNDIARGMVESTGAQFEYGQPCTVTATAYTGYTFHSWSNGVTANPYTFAVLSDVELTANFVAEGEQVYTITVQSADPTMGTASGGGQALRGGTLTIRAQGNPGYRFLRWQDNNTDSVRTVTVTGNATYTAYFAETVGVEDVADGEGVRVWSFDGRIHVVGAEGMDVNVYDMLGRRINGKRKVESGKLELAVPAGVYLVRIGDLPARKVVVIKR